MAESLSAELLERCRAAKLTGLGYQQVCSVLQFNTHAGLAAYTALLGSWDGLRRLHAAPDCPWG